MGQFETGYVGTQHCFLAHVHGRLVGYVTFHSGLDDWCLDLVRHVDDLPDGSMFALVDAAICAARATGIAQVSLAAIPACPKSSGRLWHWIGTQMVARGGGSGLRQFKSCFSPRWQPAYAAAPNWPVLALALADITRAVHLPAKPVAAKAHDRDENYEVASRRTS